MLNGTTAEIKPREALRINPAKTCQPIGAMYAALGINGRSRMTKDTLRDAVTRREAEEAGAPRATRR